MDLPAANAIWVGRTLGPVHAACLSSFVAAGHKTVLHCYELPKDVPAGAEIADARRLMPESAIVRYRKSGSYALFANLYRLKILEAGLGLYLDCDVYCLKPVADHDYIFGFESDTQINNAVLKFPRDSDALKNFLAATGKRNFVPAAERQEGNRRPGDNRSAPLGHAWSEGIDAIHSRGGSYRLRRTGGRLLSGPHGQVGLLVDPGLKLDELITARTLCFHLYHQKLKPFLANIPPASPLGQLMLRVGAPLAAYQ